MSTYDRAVEIATGAHAGQTDKAGRPYIEHPLRVASTLAGEEERIVAVLHDVLEDCPAWTVERLQGEGFSPSVISGLLAVTRQPGEGYDDFVRRAAADPIGRAVKRADLLDNADLSRIEAPTDRDQARTEKYRRALATLEDAATKAR
jgi:hypothetical protein